MTHDATDLNKQKGALGESIVKNILTLRGGIVTRPDNKADDEATLVDFLVEPKRKGFFKKQLAEVKVRCQEMPYAYGQYPCYTFPVAQIEAYKRYAKEQGLPLLLWIVNPTLELIFFWLSRRIRA